MDLFYVLASNDCSAGYANCCTDPGLAVILGIIQDVIGIIQLVVPIILLVMVMIQFTMMVINPDDKKSTKSLFNKFAAAIFIFLIPIIVNIAMGILPDSFDFPNCWKAAGEEAEKINERKWEVHKPPETEKRDSVTMITPKKRGSGAVSSTSGAVGVNIIMEALKYVGKLDYVYGGTSLTDGADCSGFVQAIYATQGITLPRTSKEQCATGTQIFGESNLQAGDLVCYPGHVAMYTGKNNELIHAPQTGSKVRVQTIYKTPFYKRVV